MDRPPPETQSGGDKPAFSAGTWFLPNIFVAAGSEKTNASFMYDGADFDEAERGQMLANLIRANRLIRIPAKPIMRVVPKIHAPQRIIVFDIGDWRTPTQH